MKRYRILIVLLMLVGSAAAQDIRPSGMLLRGSFWAMNDMRTMVSVSHDGESVQIGPAGGWVVFYSRFSERTTLEISLGLVSQVDVETNHYEDDVDVKTISPILAGLRYRILPYGNPSAIQPYVAAGLGPYVMWHVVVNDDWIEQDTDVKSDLWMGAYAGGGFLFHVADWFAINMDIKYHMVGFNPGHDYSGVEFGLGFGFMWGPPNRNGG